MMNWTSSSAFGAQLIRLQSRIGQGRELSYLQCSLATGVLVAIQFVILSLGMTSRGINAEAASLNNTLWRSSVERSQPPSQACHFQASFPSSRNFTTSPGKGRRCIVPLKESCITTYPVLTSTLEYLKQPRPEAGHLTD